jgi:IS5 family transposase
MRKKYEPQIELGAIPIPMIQIPVDKRDELPGILRGLQWIYMTPEVFNPIMDLLSEKIQSEKSETGRWGMNLWQILVLGVLRNGLEANFSRLTDLANNHRLIRQMLGVVSLVDEADFHYQTICDNVNHIDGETLRKINIIIASEGGNIFKKNEEEGLEIRTDGYVLETNVHFPTDMNLLWDCARKCLDIIEKLDGKGLVRGWRKLDNWRKDLKYRKIGLERANRGGGANKEKRIAKAVEKYLAKTHALEVKISDTLEALSAIMTEPKTVLLHLELSDYHDLMKHHIKLVNQRLVEGIPVEHEEKYFSIFERHTEWIKKGKSGNRVELGHNVLISADQHRLIRDYEVLNKKSEKEAIHGAVDRLKKNYSEEIELLSADKGFYSKENVEKLEEKVERVVIPKTGKRTKKQKEREEEKDFKEARKRHSGIESVINSLEHHGMGRCFNKGLDGFERCVGFGVLSYNLHQIGNKLISLEEESLERLKIKAA